MRPVIVLSPGNFTGASGAAVAGAGVEAAGVSLPFGAEDPPPQAAASNNKVTAAHTSRRRNIQSPPQTEACNPILRPICHMPNSVAFAPGPVSAIIVGLAQAVFRLRSGRPEPSRGGESRAGVPA